MYLKHISVVNYKSHIEGKYEFSKDINCFTGNNGVGKTNLLDAIYYLSFTKSFFHSIDANNINFNSDFFMIQGEYQMEEEVDKVNIGLKKGKKKAVKRNGKLYSKIAEHIGNYPLVMVSPADSELITEGSEVRRKFMDGVISQFDGLYLKNLIRYNKALAQRNALLKSFAESGRVDYDTLHLWNDQLVQYAKPVHNVRKQFISDFTPIFSKYYNLISSSVEEVTLSYHSDLIESDLMELLKETIPMDLRSQHTKRGVHRDDLKFLIADHSIKKFGSQGQQKTYLLALKLAQFEIIQKTLGKKPILLLDDIFDKLDKERLKSLMELVSAHNFGQIFISDTDAHRIMDLFEHIDMKPKIFTIE